MVRSFGALIALFVGFQGLLVNAESIEPAENDTAPAAQGWLVHAPSIPVPLVRLTLEPSGDGWTEILEDSGRVEWIRAVHSVSGTDVEFDGATLAQRKPAVPASLNLIHYHASCADRTFARSRWQVYTGEWAPLTEIAIPPGSPNARTITAIPTTPIDEMINEACAQASVAGFKSVSAQPMARIASPLPAPANGLSCPNIGTIAASVPYPRAAWQAGLREGSAKLVVDFDGAGHARAIKVDSTDAAFDCAAIVAARKLECTVSQGAPVRANWSVGFKTE